MRSSAGHRRPTLAHRRRLILEQCGKHCGLVSPVKGLWPVIIL
jgi:hypothetical protein